LRFASKEQVEAERTNVSEFQLLEHDSLNSENAKVRQFYRSNGPKPPQANDEVDWTFDAVTNTLVLEHFLSTPSSIFSALSLDPEDLHYRRTCIQTEVKLDSWTQLRKA